MLSVVLHVQLLLCLRLNLLYQLKYFMIRHTTQSRKDRVYFVYI